MIHLVKEEENEIEQGRRSEKGEEQTHIFLCMINGFLTKTVQSVGSEVRRTITTRQDFYKSQSCCCDALLQFNFEECDCLENLSEVNTVVFSLQ